MADEIDLTGKVIDGRYRVLERLGRGGMGAVFRVQHIHSHEHFALKVLHPSVAADRMMVERFVREARAAAALRSKHVVKVVDAQRDHMLDGTPMPYLVMELLTGSNVEAIAARRGPLPAAEVAWMLKQVGKALEQAHDRGIVHRDLKPENLFVALDEEGEPVTKVCDFGIAKLVGESAVGMLATGALETAPSSLGTPMYMSPEQIRDASTVDARTDQWALALIVYRLLAGREYFSDARSSGQLMAKILVDPIAAPSEKGLPLGAAFDAWFLRCCAREPRDRYPNTAAQVEAALAALAVEAPTPVQLPKETGAVESAVTGVAPVATGAPAATTNRRPSEGTSSRRRFAVAFGGALLLLGGVLVGIRFTPRSPPAGPSAATSPPPVASTSTIAVAAPIATTKPSEPVSAPSASVPVAKTVAATAVAPAHPPPPKPTVSASASAPAAVAKTKLPPGAACARGGECASGYCFAEQCQ